MIHRVFLYLRDINQSITVSENFLDFSGAIQIGYVRYQAKSGMLIHHRIILSISKKKEKDLKDL